MEHSLSFEEWKKTDDYVVFKHNCLGYMNFLRDNNRDEDFETVARYAFETGFDSGVEYYN